MSITAIKMLAKQALQHVGLELHRLKYVNSEATVLQHLLAGSQIDTVLDVGANTGQYARLLRRSGFGGRIVSFEAIPEVHAQLVVAAAGDRAWTVAPCAALGSRNGEVDIHVARNSVSSSVLPVHRAHLEVAPDSVYVDQRRVCMARLDGIAMPLLVGPGELMLKIDTQGYEREVLLGATELMGRIAALQVELSLATLYEGAPGFTPMVAFIENLGYELFSIVPGLRNPQTGRLLQVDGFFVRRAWQAAGNGR